MLIRQLALPVTGYAPCIDLCKLFSDLFEFDKIFLKNWCCVCHWVIAINIFIALFIHSHRTEITEHYIL
jgi:hypothetical protein